MMTWPFVIFSGRLHARLQTGDVFSLVSLESWASRLVALAHAPSTQTNMTAHARSFRNFCEQYSLCTFPVSLESISLYVAYLVAHRRAYGTILNHISSLKHFHQLAGYELTWSSDYRFTLLLRGAKRFLGQAVSRKSAITPHILYGMFVLFDFSLPLHAAMWALFLVAFFTLLRKSNLVADNPQDISSKVITRADLVFTDSGAQIFVRATKTIQFQQRALTLPLPSISGSRSCPVAALRHHLALNPGSGSTPLFSVLSGSQLHPITYRQFSVFLSKVISQLHLDPSFFSPHSFRRGGATFAFDCGLPPEIIKCLGDWQSDAYLLYLELSDKQKLHACHAMAHKLQAMF